MPPAWLQASAKNCEFVDEVFIGWSFVIEDRTSCNSVTSQRYFYYDTNIQFYYTTITNWANSMQQYFVQKFKFPNTETLFEPIVYRHSKTQHYTEQTYRK